MIKGFEDYTAVLSTYEKEVLLPIIITGLSVKLGEANAVKNKEIVNALKPKGFNISEARVRKLINHIRSKGLVKNLIANSKGYYISDNVEELNAYISSLRSRANAINHIADQLNSQLISKRFQDAQKNNGLQRERG